MYYAQTSYDQERLNNFESVVNKYFSMVKDDLIIKKPNSLYPRIATSNYRGVKAGVQLVKQLCLNLINNPPISIIFDIINSSLTYDKTHQVVVSNKPLSFIFLVNQIPQYLLQNDSYYISKLIENNKPLDIIKKIMDTCDLTITELNSITKYRKKTKINEPITISFD